MLSDSSQAAAARRLIPHRQYAEQKGVSTKTIDRWVADGILAKPVRINNRKYHEEGSEPRRDREAAT